MSRARYGLLVKRNIRHAVMDDNLRLLIYFVLTVCCKIISTNGAYIDCFKENLRRRNYSKNPGALKLDDVTPETCYTRCGSMGYLYAGLGNGYMCFCSNTDPSSVMQAESSKCTVPCRGDSAQNCGSLTHISVYDAKAPIYVSVTPSTRIISSGSLLTLTPSVTTSTGTVTSYSLRVDYNESGFDAGYINNGVGLTSWKYNLAGQYAIKTYANYQTEPVSEAVTETGILVHTPVGGLTLTCPSQMATYEEDTCTLTVNRGTDMTVSFTYTDGTAVNKTFAIADALESSFGHAPLETLQTSNTSFKENLPTGGLYFLTRNNAKGSGRLVGIEFFAMVSGSVDIGIYGHTCGSGNYCHKFDDCNSCVSCSGASSFCTDLDSCCDKPPLRAEIPQHSFTYKKTITLIATTVGKHYVNVTSENYDVLPGDTLVIQAINGDNVIAIIEEDVPSNTSDIFCSGDTLAVSPKTPSSCTTALGKIHQIRAIYAKESTVKFPLTFNNPGSVTLQATVRNRQISASESTTAAITVLEGVNFAIFDFKACYESSVAVTLNLVPFTGSGVSVFWEFGDTSTHTVTTAPLTQVQHTYAAIGQYNVSVNISNALSFKSNITTICVQERIGSVTYSIPEFSTGIVKLGDQHSTSIIMSSGSDYTCVITYSFSDGTTDGNVLTPQTGLNLLWTFTIPGTMLVSTTCSNLINEVTHTQTLKVVEGIGGLALAQTGSITGFEFQLILEWQSGSGVNISLNYDAEFVPMTVFDSDRRAVSGMRPAEFALVTHNLAVSIGNELGIYTFNLNFTIEELASGVEKNCTFPGEITTSQTTYTVIGVGSNVICYGSVASGTNIEFIVDWGDGSPQDSSTIAPATSNSKTKTFTSPQYTDITVSVKNALSTESKVYPVMVTSGVDNIFLNPVSYVVFTPPAEVIFTWNISGVTHVPIGVTCEMYWGDNNNNVINNCDLTQPLNHTYFDAAGNLNLTYTISNVVNSVSGSILVEVISPIVDMECFTSPKAFSPGEPGAIVVKFRRAPGPGVLDLEFDCDALTPGMDLSRKRESESPDGEDHINCTFATPGTYTFSIKATSVSETKTCTETFKVLQPVTEDFDVLTNAPVDYDFTSNCDLVFKIDYTGVPYPDEAIILFEFGDGNTKSPIPFADDTEVTHSYSGPGHYTTNVTIYNDATTITRLLNSGCYQKFVNVTMEVYRKPFLPLDVADQVPLGTNQDKFLVTDLVKMHMSMSAGTLVWWEITAISTATLFSCNTTETSVLSIEVNEVGTYNLSVLPLNVLFSGPLVSTTIKVVSPAENIMITDNGTTGANENKTFYISMEKYGTDMCVKVTNGYSANPFFFGDSTTCAMDADYLPSRFDGSLDVSQAFSLTYLYTTEGSYNLTVDAWTDFSSASKYFQFPVSAVDCRSPTPHIQQSRTFLDPLPYFRSKRIKLVGITNINCNYTLKNSKLWTAALWDRNNNTLISDVDITSIPSYNHSELSIDPLWLEYGVYRFTYKITMHASGSGGEEFSGTDETFIEVIPSDLIVQISEGRMSLLTVGPNVDVTLAPFDYSYDPDSDTSLGMVKTLDSFEMSCRDVTNKSETFELPLSNETITAYNSSNLPGGLTAGGCFQQGQGWIQGFGGSLTFNTDVLEQYHTYEFFVNGTRNTTRYSNDTIRIKVLHDDPPDFKIDFKVPSVFKPHPEGKSFNPNSQLGLVANVSSTCSGCTYSHEWKMFAHDYQYCDLDKDVGCWRELTYLPIHIEGVYSKELTIKTTVFSHYSTVDKFQVRHLVTDPIRAVTGEIHLNLIRNHPPYGGQCTITPSSGIGLQDYFKIRCEDFKDDEQEVASYRIICGDNGNTVARGLHNGQTFVEWIDLTLPVGNVNNNYSLSCQVIVTDTYNAEGVYDIDPVTVNQLEVTDIREYMAILRNQTADQADKVASQATLGGVCGFAASLSAAMTYTSEDDEFSEFAKIGAAVSFRRTRFGETNSRPDAFQQVRIAAELALAFDIQTVFNKTELELYEQYRDNTATVYTQITESMGSCTVESAAEAMLLTSTVATLSTGIEFLPRTAQATLTVLLEQGVDVIARNIESNTATVEEVEAVAKAAMDGCANIQQASSLSANHPTNTDLETQVEVVPFFSSNMDTKLDDVATFDNDADVLKNGKTITNKQDQIAFAEGNVASCSHLKDTVILQLAYFKTTSDIPTELKSGSMDMKLVKNDPSFFENANFATDVGEVDLPSGILDGESSDETVVFSVMAQVASGEVNDDSPVSAMSGKVSIKFQYPNGTERSVSNLRTPVRVTINQEQNNNLIIPFDDLEYAYPIIRNGYFFFQQANVTKQNAALMIRFRPTNITSTTQLLVVVYYNEKPASTYDKSLVKKACMIPSHTNLAGTYGDTSTVDPYSCFVDSDIVGENMGPWFIGIRQLTIPELNTIFSKDYLPDVLPTRWTTYLNFTQNFKLKAEEINCVYMDDGSSTIRYDGVKPSAFSTEYQLVCETTHLTTFTGGLAVAPNTIDWNFVFSNADFLKNPTLYITEMLILVLYIIAMIWARRKDKKDVEKLGLAPLLDNDPRDKYYYEIMVNTGMRRNAGTESKVHFILSGEEDETEVRTFTDKKRKIMCRGNTDGFLMAVPSSLGALNYLRIWHDNSGQGKMASWYLNYIVIRDVQTDKKYYFIANKWFAVEEDDGQVDRVIPVAGKEQMTEFSHLFAERASKNLSDGHLWFSVVARPPQSRFTRCQRVSCCLCLLYVSMLANAMFYELATSDSSAFQFGPFAMSLEQIYVGVISNIIIFPVNFLIMTLFRKSRPRKLRPSRVEEALKSSPQRTTSMTDVNPRVKSSMDVDRPGSSFLMDAKRSASSMSRPESSMSAVATRIEQDKGKKKCQLPWWCVIVAWVLLYLTVAVSAAFVTFYGIMFQDIKCRKWITSLLISFFTSIFLTQPIKVFLFAIVFSLIIRKPENDQDEDDDEEPRKQPDMDEEYLYKEEDYSLVGPQRPMYKPKPPNAKVLEAARQKRLKEIQMWSVVREIVIYAFFLWILMVISYRSVSSDSYNYKYNMEKVFILTNDTNHAFTKIKNVQDFWVWAKTGMLRGLRAGPYYNNFPPFYLRGYINDKVSRLMGYAVLRQLRVEAGSCKVPSQVDSVIDECNAPFEISVEETRNFGPNWTDFGSSNVTSEPYLYQDANTLDGYPYWGDTGVLYSGGGYIYRLNRDYFDMIADLDQLESEKWIDEYTRAVFLEFTVYNPSINLFAISTLVAEFRPSGGVIPTYRFEPCTLLPYNTGVLIFQIICEVIYLVFTVFFVCKEIRNIYKQKLKYFLQFWNIIEFSICAMSVSATVIYFYRLICINDLSTYFKETSGNGYMKFQYVGYWSELFNYMIGFLVFFASLKFLKLLRFNKRISLLADTLRNSAKDLIHFSIIFNIVFLAFVQVFYLVYHSNLDIFKTFMSSCEAGIVMMMGKFDIYNMSKVNQWFTQIFLFLFVVTITFIVVNMFLSILNDTFGTVRSNLAKQQNDYEIIDFMMNRFKCWTGLGKNNSATISPADMEAERAKNYQTLEGQIDYFPNQIDRFLASISHMYMEKSKFDDFLQKGAYGKMMMKARAHNDPFTPHPAPSHPGALRLSHGARGMTDVQTD